MKETPKAKGRVIVCSRCGKKIGSITLKWRFRYKLVFWGLVIAIPIEIIAQIVANLLIAQRCYI